MGIITLYVAKTALYVTLILNMGWKGATLGLLLEIFNMIQSSMLVNHTKLMEERK